MIFEKQETSKPLIVRDSMLLPFRGSELWGIELDGLGDNTQLVKDKFSRDIAYARRPSTTSAVIVHLKDTQAPPDLLDHIALGLNSPHIRRVALVGLDPRARRKATAAITAHGCACSIKAFADYEKAKEWLIP